MLHIVIATGNRHKFSELKRLLPVAQVRYHALREFSRLPRIVERGRTFDANASIKARVIARATGMWALADDSGIEVDALVQRFTAGESMEDLQQDYHCDEKQIQEAIRFRLPAAA